MKGGLLEDSHGENMSIRSDYFYDRMFSIF